MTAVEVLDRVLKSGGQVLPGPDRPRVLVPTNLKPLVQEHREGLRRLIGEYSDALAGAYRRYWTLSEADPQETFMAAYREIVTLEARNLPDASWWTLRKTATAFHLETGTCPFCRERGPLHLPAEQRELELMEGRP